MENPKTITLRKSVLAQYKGLSWTATEIAAKFEISVKEANEALVHFDLKKGTKKALKVPAYIISYDDDLAVDHTEPANNVGDSQEEVTEVIEELQTESTFE